MTFLAETDVEMPDDDGPPPDMSPGSTRGNQPHDRLTANGIPSCVNQFVFEHKSHKQIAQALGIKENSSASQLLRAKRLLARMINQYIQGHDD